MMSKGYFREQKHYQLHEIARELGIAVKEAQRLAGLRPDAPCGGAGTCGKCQVVVNGRSVPACQTQIREDVQIDTTASSSLEDAVILTDGFSRPVAFKPRIAVRSV